MKDYIIDAVLILLVGLFTAILIDSVTHLNILGLGL